MTKQLAIRQRIRKAILLITFLSFPITMNYLSPYITMDGAMNGILTGSMIMFGIMFVLSLFLGRLWCGWVCPVSGFQEMIEPINNRPVNRKKTDWIKWLIWIPWISTIIFAIFKGGGIKTIDFLHMTQDGISVAGSPDRPIMIAYIIYYFILLLFVLIPILVGKKAACHTLCWMAPFMIIGRWIRNRFGWASLRLTADASACTNCQQCTAHCPMSLDVNQMVQTGKMENTECILCGNCVDQCQKKVIRYSFSRGNK